MRAGPEGPAIARQDGGSVLNAVRRMLSRPSMNRSGRLARLVLCLALLPLIAAAAFTGTARVRAAEQVYFPETGLTLSNEHGFLDYWRAHGGLAQFGYPRTPEI